MILKFGVVKFRMVMVIIFMKLYVLVVSVIGIL